MPRSKNLTGSKISRAKKGSGKWPCLFEDCRTRLSRKADVLRHVETHSNHTIYKNRCGECHYSTRQRVNLNAHLIRRHEAGIIDSELSRRAHPLSKRKTPKAKNASESLTVTDSVADVDCVVLHPPYIPQAKQSSSATTSTYSPNPAMSGFPTNTTHHAIQAKSPQILNPASAPQIPTSAPSKNALPSPIPVHTGSSACAPTCGSSIAASGSLINPPPRPPVLLPSAIWNLAAAPTTFFALGTSIYDKRSYQEVFPATAPFQGIGYERSKAPVHQASLPCSPSCYQAATPLPQPYRSSDSYEEYGHGEYLSAPVQTFGVASQVPTPSYPISYLSTASHNSFYPYNPYSSRSVTNSCYGASGQVSYC